MKKLSVRLTTFGHLFLLILLPMFFGAVNYNNSLAYLLVFVFFSLYILTFYLGWKNLKDLEITLYPVNSHFVGDAIGIHTQIFCSGKNKNNKLKFISYKYCFNKSQPNTLKNMIPMFDIKSEQINKPKLTIKAKKRGDFQLSEFSCTSQYPLALFQWMHKNMDSEINNFYIYPEPVDWLNTEFEQNVMVHNKTGTEQFKELSRYQIGDSLAKVCWKTYARNEQLMIKIFENEQQEQQIIYNWDDLGRMSSEQKLSQLCYWVKQAHKKGLFYGLNIPGHTITPNHGVAHYHKCLVAMALY